MAYPPPNDQGRRYSSEPDIYGNYAPIYTAMEIDAIRASSRVAADTLDYIQEYVRPGISTLQLDKKIHDFILENGGIPSTLDYKGYPASCCISINHVVNHGIPSAKKFLEDGDIANIDVTVTLDGWFGDTSRMYIAGEASSIKAHRLINSCHEAMMNAIREVKPGARMGQVGWAIRQICERDHFTSVIDFGGHGVGRRFHDAPFVTHWANSPNSDLLLEEGMVFTVEPMLNAGKRDVKVLSDGWSTVTRDRSLSAQWEHTIAVTLRGYEILTKSKKDLS